MSNQKPQYKIYPVNPSGYHPVHISHIRTDRLVHMKQAEIDNLKGDISYVEPIQ